VVGDFNGDGIADLAVANMYANNVTLLFGQGDGTFTSAGTLATGVFPSAVAVGDFNGDGKLDLAVTNSYSQTVTIYLGNGAGGFNAQSAEPATDKNPVSITVADLNNDGIQDLAVASPQSNAVDIYFGKGDGTFAPETVVAAGNSPYSVVSVDVNGDGVEDVVVSDALGNEVQTIVNNIETSAIASIKGIAAPGQPIQDLLAIFPGNATYAASTSAAVQVMGTPIPTTTAISVGPPTVGVAQSVQITGIVAPATDGLISAGGQASVYDGSSLVGTRPVINGVTYFSFAYSSPGNHVYSIRYAGDANFAGSNSGAAAVEVIPVTTSQTTLATSATSVAHGTVVTLTATVTSGGKPVTQGTVNFCRANAVFCEDVVILRSAQLTANGTATVKLALPVGSNTIKAVFLGTGEISTSTSATHTVTVTGTYPVSIALSESGSAGNYTLAAKLTGGSWQLMPNQPLQIIDTSNHNLLLKQGSIVPQLFSLTPKAPMPVIAAPYAVVSGDFNGDGKMDAAVSSPKTGALEILLGNGDGTFTAKPSNLNFDEAAALVAGDFNGDGKLDLAVCDSQDGLVEILLGNGDGTFSLKAQTSTKGAGPEAMVAGDFNADGKLDLAVANTISGTVSILLGNGDGTFTADPALAGEGALTLPFSMVTADFDGDGHPDLAVANGNNTVTIINGNGDGSFTVRANSTMVFPIPIGSSPAAPNLGAIAVGDFNADGKPDLAIPVYQRLEILLNQGNDHFVPNGQALIAGNNPIAGIVVTDLNGDGLDDLAMTDYADGTLIISYSIGEGIYQQVTTALTNSNGAGWVAAADFDQDGGQDLFVNEYGAGAAEVFLNRSIFTSKISNLAVPGSGNHLLEATLAADGPYNAAVSNTMNLVGTPVQTGAPVGP
jgi:Bacterial Ig-like domain (group 3)/FG-GAP-like repeat